MRIVILASCVVAMTHSTASVVSASVIQVPSGQPTLKAAITAAISGDEIVVADGTYTGPDNRGLDFGGKNLHLHSANGSAACIIDCELAERAFNVQSGETASAILEGFTIRNGKPESGVLRGGGVFIHGTGVVTGPTVRSCTFEGCKADTGGAIAVIGSSNPVVVDCAFMGNAVTSGTSGGGGIILEGAGVSSTIEQCTFESNTANAGGAILCLGASLPFIFDCTFNKNVATGLGGAISLSGPSVGSIWSCRFFGNNGPSFGGALSTAGSSSNPSIVNCVFSGNKTKPFGHGGAISIQIGSAQIINCTMSGNEAGAINFGSAIDKISNVSCNVKNCVLWGNTAGAQILDAGSTPMVVSDSIVQGGWAGTANLDLNPFFISALGNDSLVGTPDDDLHTATGSPATDSGSNTAWNVALTTDLDGNSRFYDEPSIPDGGEGSAPIIDRGAYEHQPLCAFADLDCDGDVDGAEIAIVLGSWGPCDDCPADLNDDGTVDGADIAIVLGNWTG